jgi:hypothetical protein
VKGDKIATGGERGVRHRDGRLDLTGRADVAEGRDRCRIDRVAASAVDDRGGSCGCPQDEDLDGRRVTFGGEENHPADGVISCRLEIDTQRFGWGLLRS